jgi:hypothetical protein
MAATLSLERSELAPVCERHRVRRLSVLAGTEAEFLAQFEGDVPGDALRALQADLSATIGRDATVATEADLPPAQRRSCVASARVVWVRLPIPRWLLSSLLLVGAVPAAAFATWPAYPRDLIGVAFAFFIVFPLLVLGDPVTDLLAVAFSRERRGAFFSELKKNWKLWMAGLGSVIVCEILLLVEGQPGDWAHPVDGLLRILGPHYH